jgi:hypothetical protein
VEAAELEAAGKAGDMAAIAEKLPQFREHLTGLIKGIGKVLEKKNEGLRVNDRMTESSPVSSPALQTLLPGLRAALDAKNMKEIDKLFGEIEQLSLDTETRERINDVSDHVLMGEYQKALDELDRFLKELS